MSATSATEAAMQYSGTWDALCRILKDDGALLCQQIRVYLCLASSKSTSSLADLFVRLNQCYEISAASSLEPSRIPAACLHLQRLKQAPTAVGLQLFAGELPVALDFIN